MLCTAVYAPTLWADLAIYENGVRIASCTPTAPPEPPDATPPPPIPLQVLTWSQQNRGDNAPLDPQPLTDQSVLPAGQAYFEAVTGPVHHVDFFKGDVKLRRENYLPYSHWEVLQPGSYHLIAKIYSDETTVAATYEATFTVAAAGTPIPPIPVEHKIFVEWSAPTSRVDGTPLAGSELSGYRLRYGSVESVIQAPATKVELLLLPGTYTFTVTAIDTNGLESDPSDPVSVTF
jgi:hypothetical protein